MDCPKCDSSRHVKAGTVKQRQRYRCKGCGYHYTVKRRSPRIPESIKRFAVELYLEELGFRLLRFNVEGIILGSGRNGFSKNAIHTAA